MQECVLWGVSCMGSVLYAGMCFMGSELYGECAVWGV